MFSAIYFMYWKMEADKIRFFLETDTSSEIWQAIQEANHSFVK